MTSREFDVAVVAFSVGALAFLWVGYRLRVRVERWYARGAARQRERAFDRRALTPTEQDARMVLRNVRARQKVIPIPKHGPNTERALNDAHDPQWIPIIRDPSKGEPIPAEPGVVGLNQRATFRWVPAPGKEDQIPIAPGVVGLDETPWSHPDHPANLTARAIRADVFAVLVDAGFKKAAASAAIDECTLAERAGGLESWVAAALRRAAVPK